MTYAAGHAAFEARSDQRALLTRWLVERLAPRADADSSVLSIGTGDGSVDEPLAALLTSRGHRVSYVGIEPHAASGSKFLQRLQAIIGDGVTLATTGLAGYDPSARPSQIVLAVHSLYYVGDLARAVTKAFAFVAPEGELVVLHAPGEALNQLVKLLAPGPPQEFSDSVGLALAALPGRPCITRTRIDAQLDLAAGADLAEWHQVLDFTVQARIPETLRPWVIDALRVASVRSSDMILPHPIDAFVVTHRPR